MVACPTRSTFHILHHKFAVSRRYSQDPTEIQNNITIIIAIAHTAHHIYEFLHSLEIPIAQVRLSPDPFPIFEGGVRQRQTNNHLNMAAPAQASKKRSNVGIRQFKERKKCHFNIAANLTLNTMVSFIILLITRTARIACPDRHKTTTVTLAAHARRGLIMVEYK